MNRRGHLFICAVTASAEALWDSAADNGPSFWYVAGASPAAAALSGRLPCRDVMPAGVSRHGTAYRRPLLAGAASGFCDAYTLQQNSCPDPAQTRLRAATTTKHETAVTAAQHQQNTKHTPRTEPGCVFMFVA